MAAARLQLVSDLLGGMVITTTSYTRLIIGIVLIAVNFWFLFIARRYIQSADILRTKLLYH